MNKEFNVEIRNKLQVSLTTLELLKEDKPLPKEFIEIALKNLKKKEGG